ncbi:uncharacterized protein LOC111088602 isoform X2 [Limulus polyphemus]|uniref:Uncharacterized protein LOC111088602 isoform X2 n=1 Tax=Limulus polyphemus TaxID=6850 RepID=A0ABM1TGC1_LIMPO|nr:uncharacterized protein LOC111088602 isoform X2 [Limulus polyphemus]
MKSGTIQHKMQSTIRKDQRLSISRSTENLTISSISGERQPKFLYMESETSNVRQYPRGSEQVSLSFSDVEDTKLPVRSDVVKEGYMYLYKNAEIILRVWVALGTHKIYLYSCVTDILPMDGFHLSSCEIETSTLDNYEPSGGFFPLRIVKEGQNLLCLYTRTSEDHKDWKEALSSCVQSCSLNMEGLNLEYGDMKRRTEFRRCKGGLQTEDDTLNKKLELLKELLKQKRDITDRKRRCFTKMQSSEETSFSSSHQEALQRATHLRQRKISTQLKMDTLQKHLQGNKKSPPHNIHNIPQVHQHFQEQLIELNRTLKKIDDNLGKTKRELGATFGDLDIKTSNTSHVKPTMESNSVKNPCKRNPIESYQDKLPKIHISKSIDDCRDVSLKGKVAKLIYSPKFRKKLRTDGVKTTESFPSLPHVVKSSSKDKETEYINDSKEGRSRPQTTKTRRSPLRKLGNYMELQIRGRIISHRRNKSAERPFERPREDHYRPRSSSNEDLLYKGNGNSATKTTEDFGNDAQYGNSGKHEDPEQQKSRTTITRDDNINKKESIEKETTDVRTEINPDVMAEIEAFEQLTQDYFLTQERHVH